MGWIDDVSSAVGWLSAAVGPGSPQQLQATFQQLGVSAEDFLSVWNYYYTRQDQSGSGWSGQAGETPFMQRVDQWLNTPLRRPGQPQSAATPQPGASAPVQMPGNVSQAGVAGVLRAAQELGVPPQLALAIAAQETGGTFDPYAHNAVGEDSWGVFQLNTQGGEGAGLPQYVLTDPYLNARVALAQVKAVMQQHPDWSPGQIAAAAQRPGDPTGYASSVNNYVDSIQTGQGSLSWASGIIKTGLQGVPGDPTFQANPVYGTSQVPLPFNAGFFGNITQGFGTNGEEGTDFGMPVGQQIVTPVGGVVTLRDDGKQNWGKAVYVRTPNGWTYFVGHLSQFDVQNGQQVGPGDTIGLSGGDPSDPSSGDSTGPHIEIRFIDPGGQNHDPMPFLQQVFSGRGVQFQSWMGGVFAGSAQPAPVAQKLVRTGDNRIVDLNTTMGQWYSTVNNLWSAVFGTAAPLQAALEFQRAGITTQQGVQDAINQLPSGVISGVSIGSFLQLQTAVNAQAQKSFGRSVPQSLAVELYQQGIRSPSAIQLWFDTHSSSDIPPGDYQQVFDAANSYTQAVWGDAPHPSDVAQIWQQAGGQPMTNIANLPPSTQIAKTIGDTAAGVF